MRTNRKEKRWVSVQGPIVYFSDDIGLIVQFSDGPTGCGKNETKDGELEESESAMPHLKNSFTRIALLWPKYVKMLKPTFKIIFYKEIYFFSVL